MYRLSGTILFSVLLSALNASAQGLFPTGTVNGSGAGYGLGDAVACHGQRVLVGVPHAPAGGFPNTGEVRLYQGSTPPALLGVLPLPFSPGPGGELFGANVEFVDDFNGDGQADIAVGSPGIGSGDGSAFFYTDPNAIPVASISGTIAARMGESIASLGDVNGDNRGDVAIGAPLDVTANGATGAVRIYSPGTALVLGSIPGTAANDRMGHAVGSVGDLTGDGVRELLAGAPGFNARGQVVVINPTNNATVAALTGPSVTLSFGHSVSGVGDLDGDGTDDFAVGAPPRAANPGNGQVFVYSGANIGTAATVLCVLSDSTLGSSFGSAVKGVGDLNGDGVPEFVVGAPNTNTVNGQSAVRQGAFVVYSYNRFESRCEPTESVAGFQLPGFELGVSFGGGQCDFENDGLRDVVVGARANSNGVDSGSALFYSGTGQPSPFGPHSARLNFKINSDGLLKVKIEFDRSAAGLCEYGLLARIQTGSGVGKIVELDRGPIDSSVVKLFAFDLPRVTKIDGEKAIVHMLAETICPGAAFDSNVAARYLFCGLGDGAQPNEWVDAVQSRIITESDPRFTARLRAYRRMRAKRSRRRNRR